MAQVLKYWDGANPKIYDIVSQDEEGRWHMTRHMTDRILEYDCELVEDGIGQHLRYGHGSFTPLRDSKGQLFSRWSEATEQDINDRPVKREASPAGDMAGKPEEQEEAVAVQEPAAPCGQPGYTDAAELERLRAENEALLARIAEAEAATSQSNQNTQSNKNTQSTQNNQHNLMKAFGSVAAMTVALVVVWQTGLLIPLGLIGLTAAGILK